MSYARIRSCSLIAALAALTACGGGSSAVSVTTYPVDLALGDFFQMAHSYQLHGSIGSDDYTLDLKITPGPSVKFNGAPAMTSVDDTTLTKNGTTVSSGSATDYFLSTPFTQLGTVLSNGTSIVDSNQKALPEFVDVGTQGSLDDQQYFSGGSQVATGSRTWTLTALTSDTAQFCIHDTDDLGGASETEIDCYDMDAKGNVTAIEVTEISGGQTLILK